MLQPSTFFHNDTFPIASNLPFDRVFSILAHGLQEETYIGRCKSFFVFKLTRKPELTIIANDLFYSNYLKVSKRASYIRLNTPSGVHINKNTSRV